MMKNLKGILIEIENPTEKIVISLEYTIYGKN